MTAILLDTNVYTAFARGRPDAVAAVQAASAVSVTPVILGEPFGGFRAGSKGRANRATLAAFLASPRVTVLSIDQETAERYAVIYAGLRAAGTPIPTNDMWIAASAMQHSLHVFTYDAHFKNVAGLMLV